uniref:Uncharacterized protein n=1 Tax=Fagus sylvatica TaxID=28930 RepID=A0A2N9IHE4_FAGSY
MAKSSSNGDLCDRAIQIIEALPADQNIRGYPLPKLNKWKKLGINEAIHASKEAWMHAKYSEEISTYPTCFKLFSDLLRERSPKDYMPFEAKQYGFEDFKSFSN